VRDITAPVDARVSRVSRLSDLVLFSDGVDLFSSWIAGFWLKLGSSSQ